MTYTPTEEDWIIINTPPTSDEVSKGWRKLSPVKESTNRIIYSFQCLYCKKIYGNHKNAKQHLDRCPQKNPPQNSSNQSLITEYIINKNDIFNEIDQTAKFKSLITLIAFHNIPYSQIHSFAWKHFFKSFDPTFVIPGEKVLIDGIHNFAMELEAKSYNSFCNSSKGIAIDGAGFNLSKYYAVVLINSKIVRIAKIYHVERQTADQLSAILADTINKATKNRILISAICSDNARNLVAACNTETGKLKALIGMYLLRVACAAHTSQLSIGDIKEICPEIAQVFIETIELLYFIDRHDAEFKTYIKIEHPKYVQTRWNSACTVLEFLCTNCEKINQFLIDVSNSEQRQYEQKQLKNNMRIAKGLLPKNISPPDIPQLQEIPDSWFHAYEALKAIYNFTKNIEGDQCYQQQVFLEYRNTIFSLDALHNDGNIFALTLRNAFIERFTTTSDILIAELAFRFTPEGLYEWRNTYHQTLNRTLDPPPTEEALKEAFDHYNDLKNRFIQYAESSLNITTTEQKLNACIPSLFDWWLTESKVYPGESAFVYWKNAMNKKVSFPDIGKTVELKDFSMLVLALISMPASEAICERCFSRIKHLASDLNTNMKPELFESLATIKMAMYYFQKYPDTN